MLATIRARRSEARVMVRFSVTILDGHAASAPFYLCPKDSDPFRFHLSWSRGGIFP